MAAVPKTSGGASRTSDWLSTKVRSRDRSCSRTRFRPVDKAVPIELEPATALRLTPFARPTEMPSVLAVSMGLTILAWLFWYKGRPESKRIPDLNRAVTLRHNLHLVARLSVYEIQSCSCLACHSSPCTGHNKQCPSARGPQRSATTLSSRLVVEHRPPRSSRIHCKSGSNLDLVRPLSLADEQKWHQARSAIRTCGLCLRAGESV
jgi:hypothetical protein